MYARWNQSSKVLKKSMKILMKAIKYLLRILNRQLRPLCQLHKSPATPKYHPQKYWEARHAKYGFDLRGVGNCSLSHEENMRAYLDAKKVLLGLCHQESVNIETSYILDVGYGIGFYAEVFLEAGGKHYIGIDIADRQLNKVRKQFEDFEFRKLDITKQKLDSYFDLILMLDVTQHIVDDLDFSFAMQNISSHLAENGVFIVTSWLSDKTICRTYYEVARPLSRYKKEFPGYYFSKPVLFRDKFIFAVRKPYSSIEPNISDNKK